MPRGHSNMYAEFVSVRRHVLQCTATGEKDLLEKVEDHARGEHVEGFQVSDDSRPMVFHAPFGSDEFGRNYDGPAFFAGNVFGDDATWMRELARALQARADEYDAAQPTVRLLKHGLLVPKETCLRCGKTGCVEGALTVGKRGDQSLYKRCNGCGYRQNLGYAESFSVTPRIRELNAKPAKS